MKKWRIQEADYPWIGDKNNFEATYLLIQEMTCILKLWRADGQTFVALSVLFCLIIKVSQKTPKYLDRRGDWKCKQYTHRQ